MTAAAIGDQSVEIGTPETITGIALQGVGMVQVAIYTRSESRTK